MLQLIVLEGQSMVPLLLLIVVKTLECPMMWMDDVYLVPVQVSIYRVT